MDHPATGMTTDKIGQWVSLYCFYYLCKKLFLFSFSYLTSKRFLFHLHFYWVIATLVFVLLKVLIIYIFLQKIKVSKNHNLKKHNIINDLISNIYIYIYISIYI